MDALLNFKKNLNKRKKAQIFLVCTIIITIYMLSFITIVYELNVNQYSRTTELTEFQATYDNLKTETDAFIKGLLANYTLPTSVIADEIDAGAVLQTWLDFAEARILAKGYFAVLEINEIVPVTQPIAIGNGDGFASIQANIDIYMECNYLSIDTEFQYNYLYTMDASVGSSLISVYYTSIYGVNYIGYADVTVNGAATTNLYDGTYTYSAPLVAGDVIQAITPEQIIITLTV